MLWKIQRYLRWLNYPRLKPSIQCRNPLVFLSKPQCERPPPTVVHRSPPSTHLRWCSTGWSQEGALGSLLPTSVSLLVCSIRYGSAHIQSREAGLQAVVVNSHHQLRLGQSQVNTWKVHGERSVQCSTSSVLAQSRRTDRPWHLSPLTSVHLRLSNRLPNSCFQQCVLVSFTHYGGKNLIRMLTDLFFYTWFFLSTPEFDMPIY